MADSLKTGENKDVRNKNKDQDKLQKLEVELCALRILFVASSIAIGVLLSVIVPVYLSRVNTCSPNLRF